MAMSREQIDEQLKRNVLWIRTAYPHHNSSLLTVSPAAALPPAPQRIDSGWSYMFAVLAVDTRALVGPTRSQPPAPGELLPGLSERSTRVPTRSTVTYSAWISAATVAPCIPLCSATNPHSPMHIGR